MNSSPTAFPLKTVSGIFTAALLAFTSLSFPQSDNFNKAYRDYLGRPTICKNHFKDVKMTDVMTDKECDDLLSKDLFESINGVIYVTPFIIENSNALRASSEFVLNTNISTYENSPMAYYFSRKEWESGCKAFENYYVYARFKTNQLQYRCTVQNDGMWSCRVKELEILRREQMEICLGNL
jgi:GH24 family phage-related lysozyme (muramidase)